MKLFNMKTVRLILLATVLLLPGLTGAAPTRQGLERGVEATVDLQRQTAAAVEKWEIERRELAAETHAIELEEKLLAARLRKLEGYREQRLREIARLEKGLEDMAEIGIRLEPFLDELVIRLDDFRGRDLPFAQTERRRRLADLKEALSSYEVSLAEKLRRCFEVLGIEAGFGRGFEVGEESLELDGVETTVRVLRLGRVGLYYLSLDGSRAGWYESAAQTWQPLSAGNSEAVKQALRMALKQRAFDLVRLPVAAAGGRP